MATSRYCFTFRQIRRMVPFMFSMMLVQGQGSAQLGKQAGVVCGTNGFDDAHILERQLCLPCLRALP